MKRARAGSLLIAAICLLAPAPAAPQRAERLELWGVAYGAFRDDQEPGKAYPSKAQIAEDMRILGLFATHIRTYSVEDTQQWIPRLARAANLIVYAGAHIGSDPLFNAEEIERVIVACQVARCAGIVLGNEVIRNDDRTVPQLVELIRSVKSDPRVIRSKMRVGYSDTDAVLLLHPELAAEVDFLLVNIHPYWAGVDVEEAAEYVLERWLFVESAYPGVDVIVGETGWPTAGETVGDAVPSEHNQQVFLSDFVPLALERNVRYFLFEAFDEKWKADDPEDGVEAHWGLWYSDRTMKPRRFLETPPPLVEILRVPGCYVGDGRMGKIVGKVHGISRGELPSYRVSLYAKTNKWYVQPYQTKPLTAIRARLDWSNRIFLGDAYAAALVPEGCSPPASIEPLPAPDEGAFPGIPVPGCEALAVAVRDCQ